MKLHIFAIKDSKAEAFNTPFFQATQGQALRAFQDLANDKTSTVSMHPEDYSLYQLGYYDTDDAHIEPLNTPKYLANANDLTDLNSVPLKRVD